MIDLSINRENLTRNIKKAKENGVIIPTHQQMKHPETIPAPIREKLKSVGLWEVNPLNLFRVTWKNEPKESGGLFGTPNFIELPPELTGVPARIICLIGKWFPTGCHKVGASFGCLVPRLVTGQFDATRHKAVWPSTGNYCRGGAFNSKLLACDSIAILPAEMSRERFDWLSGIAGEVIATPGCESNVKEIFDKTWELRNTRDNVMIFNQFDEMGNHLWHYQITGSAIAEVYESVKRPGDRLAGACFTSGSAGTMGSGDYLKEVYPTMKLAVGEALQCPTILNNGFGGHRIEGIGDKHIPWIHNVKNTDMVIDIDDEDSQRLLRLFCEDAGRSYLIHEAGVDPALAEKLPLLGISGIANVLCCIKLAKYYELTAQDVVATVLTDSADMYTSRVAELAERYGAYSDKAAAVDHSLHMLGLRTDSMAELNYWQRKRIHNLKYYTWVEQQGRTMDDLNDLWYNEEKTWKGVHGQADVLDELINEFNEATGLLKTL
ncbi:MAG: pyridoxal-5-phosphate-dependent protein subunit beta [Clostridia bacterium]|nr:pyridoxal-5-phosphate-dependent protein subunit beta [Clostridia bacterium]